MSLRRLRLVEAPASFITPLVVMTVAGLGAAVMGGLATTIIGGADGLRPLYIVGVITFIVAGGLIAITRRDPLRFGFFGVIACLPIASALVPPGRLDLTVFDAAMAALTVGLLGKKLFVRPKDDLPLLPTLSMVIAWMLVIPTIVFSHYPLWSLEWSLVRFGAYMGFVFLLYELRRERGFERLVLALSLVSLVMSIGLFIDHFFHINLSMRGSNPNQTTYLQGMEIYRAGGFFHDPQKAGAFLASMISFLLLLSVRGRFRGMRMRYLVWTSIAVSLAALSVTITRNAILSCLAVSAFMLLLFNKWGAPAKLVTICAVLGVVMLAALTPVDKLLDVAPATVAERFRHTGEEVQNRLTIWFDTWDMFADNPVTGIGPGAFKLYLMDTRPGVINYYGIGVAEGIPYIPDQPESGYLKILYEGGILGTLACLLVAVDALRRAIVLISPRNPDPDVQTEAIAAVAGLLVFALTFLTLYTLGDSRIATIFGFFLAVLWHRSMELTARAPARNGSQ